MATSPANVLRNLLMPGPPSAWTPLDGRLGKRGRRCSGAVRGWFGDTPARLRRTRSDGVVRAMGAPPGGVGSARGQRDLRFGALGPLEVTVAGRPVALGGPKPRALLAALLVDANRVVRAERLVDVLWGDAPPGRAITTLQKYVHELRAALGRAGAGDGVLVTRPPGYMLVVSAEQFDAARFEQLVDEGDRAVAQLDVDRAQASFDEALAL